MNKLFNVLVLTGIPAAAVSCASDTPEGNGDDRSLGDGVAGAANSTDSADTTPEATSGASETPSGEIDLDGSSDDDVVLNADGGNANAGELEAGPQSDGEGGSAGSPANMPAPGDLEMDEGAGGKSGDPEVGTAGAGGSGGSAGSATPDAGLLDCPPEQWTCEVLTCGDGTSCGGCGVWHDPQGCACDPGRPSDASDCALGENFVCDALDASISERERISCACVPSDISEFEACGENNPEHPQAAVDDLLCYCAWLRVR